MKNNKVKSNEKKQLIIKKKKKILKYDIKNE